MQKYLKLLIVEDSDDDAQLLLLMLKKEGFITQYKRVQRPNDYIEALTAEKWDIIISDYAMPGFNGEEALMLLKESGLDIPFILLSGTVGEDIAVSMMKAGANDYIMKDHLKRIGPAIDRELKESDIRKKKKQTEEELLESQQMIQQILDTIPVNVFWKDMNLNFMGCNQSFAHEAGFVSNDQIIGKNDYDMHWKKYAKQYTEDDQYILKTLIPKINYEEMQVGLNGINRYLLTSKIPLTDINGNIKGILGTYTDITDRKIAEENLKESYEEIKKINSELAKSKQKAEENDRLKSAFLANISHEIRTPMNRILGFTEILRDEEDIAPKNKEYIEIIFSSIHQLINIINDLLDISRIEAGQFKINNSPMNINDLINEIYKTYRIDIKNKNIDFTISLGLQDHEAIIYSDSFRLKQVLNNLLNNAIKFTSNGSITIGYKAENNQIIFFVKDTGIGIPEEYYDTIFQPFRQVEEYLTRNYGGTGLGLSISKALIEFMKGRIWLESKKDKGSSFFFSIPYEKVGITTK